MKKRYLLFIRFNNNNTDHIPQIRTHIRDGDDGEEEIRIHHKNRDDDDDDAF